MANNYPTFSCIESNNGALDHNVNVAQGQMNAHPVLSESQQFNPNQPYGQNVQDAPINSSNMKSSNFNPSGDIGLSCPINSDQMKSQKPMNNMNNYNFNNFNNYNNSSMYKSQILPKKKVKIIFSSIIHIF